MSDSRLAIDGGTPVISEPLPTGVSGPSVIGDEEIAAVTEVLRSQDLFRYPKSRSEAARFEEEAARPFGRGVRADGQLRHKRAYQRAHRRGRRSRQ